MRPDELGARGPGRWVVALAVCVVAAAGSFALTYTPVFRATTIQVEGAGSIGQRRLQTLSGVRFGVNVFRLDTAAVERRLEQDPRIETATVVRRLPSTVVIDVTVRVPVARIADGLGGADVVGADGTRMGAATTGKPLPELVWAGGRIPNQAGTRVAASAAAAMSTDLRGRVRRIVTAADGSIRLLLRSGVPVSYGPPTDLVAKGQAVEAVLRWASPQGRAITAIDVNVPGAPTATVAGTTTTVA
ncbi:MAG: FtsQ-type POTRA domain-containing protein [Actinomycetota bacterium]|nr:FtsQ-type POTRA domain-containing protein [Actinomycetota bacterium]